MPSSVKHACIALIISCISTLIAVYFEGLEFDQISFSDPFTLVMNFIWTLIIAWLIWNLYIGLDITFTILVVSAIVFLSLAWSVSQYGFGWTDTFYAIELLMLFVAFFLLRKKDSKEWLSNEDSNKSLKPDPEQAAPSDEVVSNRQGKESDVSIKIEYHIVSDESYFIEGYKRYCSSNSKHALGFKILRLLILSVAFCAAAYNQSYLIASVCVLLIMFGLFIGKINQFLFKRNIRKSPHNNEELILTFTNKGVHCKSEIIDMTLSWPAYTGFKVVSEGLLLFQGPEVYNWLPDANISDVTHLGLIRALLKEKL